MFTHYGTAAAALAIALSPHARAQNPYYTTPYVISKVQLVYSVVSHRHWLSNEINFYNSYGDPAGAYNYAVPLLVCDPLITLYNPGNQAASKPQVRVQISDPPVGFKFKKNSSYLRPEFSSPGGFLPMARFQIVNESDTAARKAFRLLITGRRESPPYGGTLKLGPGQSEVFAPYIEAFWNWELETVGGYTARCFHDWDAGSNFSTIDGRTKNPFGVETLSGFDPRAGFQMDHLSHSSGRPHATRYQFEIVHGRSGGRVTIKDSDTFSVEAKAMRAVPQPNLPDFQVDLLAGRLMDPSQDILRAYPISLGSALESPEISRTFPMASLLQLHADTSPGGKTPFAMVTLIAKSEALKANRFYEKPPLPSEQLYEIYFTSLTDFSQIDSISPSDRIASGIKVHRVTRAGDQLVLDFATGPEIGSLRVMGTSSLANGFTEDLTAQTTTVPGPSGSGLSKASVNVADKGTGYFVRIEEVPGG